jgi:hypothetical protein
MLPTIPDDAWIGKSLIRQLDSHDKKRHTRRHSGEPLKPHS